MKINRITKKTKLFALALSVYFALMFTNTPNVISEEYNKQNLPTFLSLLETASEYHQKRIRLTEKPDEEETVKDAVSENSGKKPLPEKQDTSPSEKPPKTEMPDNETSVKRKKMTVTATAYCGCYDCNGKWTGYPAADGSPLRAYHTIAADESIPFGTKVYIPYFESYHNDGIFEVEDRGSAIVGNRIDIYFDSHSEALAFGMREMTIYIIT